jgi:hypothetical protein
MNDKAQKLYDLYLSQGLITEATSFDRFSSATPDQQEKLYELGKSEGLFESATVDDFKSAFQPQEEQLTEEMMETGQRDAVPMYAMTEEKYAAEKKSAGESPLQDGVSADVVEEPVAEEEPQYEAITPELVSQDEESVVPKLNELYGEDFEFEEAGAGYDSVLVKSKKTGNKEIFTLDAFTDAGNVESAAEIKEFMQQNMRKTRDELDVEYESQIASMTEDYKALDEQAEQLKKLRSSMESLIKSNVIKSEDDPRLLEFEKKQDELLKNSVALEDKYKGLLDFDKKMQEAPIVEEKFFTGEDRIIDALPVSKGDVGEALSFIDSFTENYKFIPNFGDFIDGIGSAVALGDAQADLVVVGNRVMENANKVSSEEVQKMIDIQESMQNMPQSKEMQQYDKDYNEAIEGGAGWVEAWLTSLVKNPQASAEMMVSSFTAMVNRKSLERAMAVEASAASAAAVAGIAGPQAVLPEEIVTIPAAMATAIPVAMGVAGATVEVGISTADGVREYIEELNEERKKNGEAPLDYNEETIRQVLSDKEAFNKIRNKALTRGATIGLVDAFLTRIGAKVGGKIFGKTGSRVAQAGFTAPFEMIGEGVGEGAAQYLSEGKLDFKEIAAEMSGGAYGTATTMATSVFEEGEYKVNGAASTRKKVQEILDSATPDEISKMSIEIVGDKRLSDKYRDKVDDKQILDEMPDNVQGEARQEALELEKERRRLKEAGITTFGKEKKIAEVNEKLKAIYEAEPVTEEVVTEEAAPTYEAPVQVTSPTAEAFATVNRNDGKGTVTLTEDEYNAEMEKFAPVEEAVFEDGEKITYGISEAFDIEEKILEAIPKENGLFYHGSPNIEWTTSENIDVESNTRNAPSKYLFLAEKPETALAYSKEKKGAVTEISKDSGVAVFKINKGAKVYKLTSKDVEGADTIDKLESVYDGIKEKGYDVIINTLDGNNRIILNNDIIEYRSTHKNQEKIKQDAIQKQGPEGMDVQEPTRDRQAVGEGDVREVTEEIDTEDQVAKTEEEIAKEEFDKFNAMLEGKKPKGY